MMDIFLAETIYEEERESPTVNEKIRTTYKDNLPVNQNIILL